MGRQAIENISDAMPYRRGKASNEEMYFDDEDEIAIEPTVRSKARALTPEQARGLREAGKYFGDPQKGQERIQKFRTDLAGAAASLSPRGNTGPAKVKRPAAPKRPSGVGGSADSMERQIRNRPRPSAPLSSASGNRSRNTWSGSPGGNAPRPRPAVKPPTQQSGGGGRSIGEKLKYIPSKLWQELGPR